MGGVLSSYHKAPEDDYAIYSSNVEISERQSPWVKYFRGIDYDSVPWHPCDLKVTRNGDRFLALTIWLPTTIPGDFTIPLFWNEDVTYTTTIHPRRGSDVVESGPTSEMITFTHLISKSLYGAHMPAYQDAQSPVLFSPSFSEFTDPRPISDMQGQRSASMLREGNFNGKPSGLARVNGQMNQVYFYLGIERRSNKHDKMQLIALPLTKRRDFLRLFPSANNPKKSGKWRERLPIEDCTINNLPAEYTILAAFIPSILRRLESALLAQQLQGDVLDEVRICDFCLLIEATTTPSAHETYQYNRLAVLGESVFKFCGVLQVMAEHLNQSEGYLALKLGAVRTKKALCKAALRLGIDRYITEDKFSGSQWRPSFVPSLLAAGEGKRTMSAKAIAAVASALIGAAFLDGGLDKSLACIRTLVSAQVWYEHEQSISLLTRDLREADYPGLTILEQLVGHRFGNSELLMQAVTHTSYGIGISYERLEFFGDAVLDLLLAPKLSVHRRRLTQCELNRAFQGLVNANFLAYHCMLLSLDPSSYDDMVDYQGAERVVRSKSESDVRLHDFLRMGRKENRLKREAVARFEHFRENVDSGLQYGKEYPWPEILSINAPKFLSDMIESILGALYLDTDGDLVVCEAFVEKLGILKTMRRILDDNVELAYPKEQLYLLAGNNSVTYTNKKCGDKNTCTIHVNGVKVASADGCQSKAEAEARCARQATQFLAAQTTINLKNRKRKLSFVLEDEKEADKVDDVLEKEEAGDVEL